MSRSPLLAGIAALCACHGVIGDPTHLLSDEERKRLQGELPGATCDGGRPDTTPMRLLSLVEYNNTVADLLGDRSAPLAVSPTAAGDWFDNNASALGVSERLLEHYAEVAESIASRLADHVDSILPCSPAELGEGACARSFVEQFARRAFRRPIDDGDLEGLMGLYEGGAAQGGFVEGIQWVIEGALQAPDFLYHVEVGRPDVVEGNTVALTDHEIGARLSYFLWNTMPDDALLEAADRGEVHTPEEIAGQARRLLGDPRSRVAVRHFHRQWLELDKLESASKDPTLFPEFDAMREDLAEETLAFLEETVWSGGDVRDLLLSDHSLMNDAVAGIYGVPTDPLGDEFVPTPQDPAQRAGLLTHPGLLAAHAKFERTSPIQRGLFVRRRFLCQNMPPPPPDVPPLPAIAEGVNERERLAQHRADPACAGCHQLMDPIGLAFEHYDAVGRWRDRDTDGHAVDATGEILGGTDIDGPLDGAIELSERLAESDQVRACVARQWFRYAMGRSESPDDECTLQDLEERFAEGDHRIDELLVAITQLDAFRYRDVVGRTRGDT